MAVPLQSIETMTNGVNHETNQRAQPATHGSEKYKVLIIPGDHVGPEVMKEAVKVLEVIREGRGINFELTHEIAGGCSIDKRGTPITDEVLHKAMDSDAVLFGSVGGPEW